MTAQNCLDPANCSVPSPSDVDLRRLRIARVGEGRPFHAAYRRAHWPILFNPSGAGDSRFSPLTVDGDVVPTMYGSSSMTVALLETAFHDVHQAGSRMISEALQLAPRGLVTLSTPQRLALVDLRDEALGRIGLERQHLIATSQAHYACTREWGAALCGRRIGRAQTVGLLWRSRVAELAQHDSLLLSDLMSGERCEAFMLFGNHVPTEPLAWSPGDPHFDHLTSGDGRRLADQVAEQLGAVIVPP